MYGGLSHLDIVSANSLIRVVYALFLKGFDWNGFPGGPIRTFRTWMKARVDGRKSNHGSGSITVILEDSPALQGRPRIAKPRMMKENGAKKRTAHTGSFRQQTQRTRGDAKKTMLRNCLDYFKESMLS